MTYLHLLHPKLRIYVTSWHDISVQTQNRPKMSYSGGMTGNLRTPVYLAWPLIISQFRVSPFSVFYATSYYQLLPISATSTDVKRIFSQGRIILSHIRNRLSSQSTCTLLCLGNWSLLGYIQDKDITAVTALPEVLGDEEELEAGWDSLDRD